jgi:hypothetical protein
MQTQEIVLIVLVLLIVLFILLSAFVFINNNDIKDNISRGFIEVNVADYTVPVDLYFANVNSLSEFTIDWGDGTVENKQLGTDIFLSSHTYASNGDYTINISYQGLGFEYIGNINIEFSPPDQINKIKNVNLTEFTNLKALILYDTLLSSINISNLNKLQNLAIAKGVLTTNSVNNILITFNSFNTTPGTGDLGVVLALQTAPTEEGLVAKQALIDRGWTVVTS